MFRISKGHEIRINFEPLRSLNEIDMQCKTVQSLIGNNSICALKISGKLNYAALFMNRVIGIRIRKNSIRAVLVHGTVLNADNAQFNPYEWGMTSLKIIENHFTEQNVLDARLFCIDDVVHLYILVIPVAANNKLSYSRYLHNGSSSIFIKEYYHHMEVIYSS